MHGSAVVAHVALASFADNHSDSIVLTLGSFPVLQGIKLQQLSLLVAGLIAACACMLMAEDHLTLAGILLASRPSNLNWFYPWWLGFSCGRSAIGIAGGTSCGDLSRPWRFSWLRPSTCCPVGLGVFARQ